MAELFSDIPEAIENTVEIARRCTLDITLGKNFLPNYPVPEGMTINDYFVEHSKACLERRLDEILDRKCAGFCRAPQGV
jgi:DNA polymerase-3 subunit alpha